MSTSMIPASSIDAVLSADLTYNPSIHVQTVEIDRTGTSLATIATNNFVKWYITLKDFQNLTWNVRDLPYYDGADPSFSDVSLNANNIFAFARSGDFYSANKYGSDPYDVPAFSGTDASYADAPQGVAADATRGIGSGVVLTQEASGGCVRFSKAELALSIPLYSDVPAYGEDVSAGIQSVVGATTVTYDRVLLDENASGDISGSTRTEASSTTTTWGFGTAASAQTSFNMTVNWVASQNASETGYNATDFSAANGAAGVDFAGMNHWGTNTIHVYPSGVSNINVYKPYNDAAADFIQIGMDASGGSGANATSFASGVGSTTAAGGGLGLGTTTYGVAAGDSGAGIWNSGDTDDGLVDPLKAPTSMTTASADDTTDSADFGAYFSDYTANHTTNDLNQRRNLLEVNIGKPTLKVSQKTFTKALQQAIKDHPSSDVRDVSNTQSLRYAVKEAFEANTLRGFQCGVGSSDNKAMHDGAIELALPLTVAGQNRYASTANVEIGDTTVAGVADDTGNHKKVYLTPIIELVADGYYHPAWYTYTAVA